MNSTTASSDSGIRDLPSRAAEAGAGAPHSTAGARDVVAMHKRLAQLQLAIGLNATGTGGDAARKPLSQERHIDVLSSLHHRPAIGMRLPLSAHAMLTTLVLVATALVWWAFQPREPLRDHHTAALAETKRWIPAAEPAMPPITPGPQATRPTSAALTAEAEPTQAIAVSAAQAGAATASPTAEAVLKERLESWRLAWAARDVDAYLKHYSSGFVPSNGLTRAAWASARQRIISSRPEIVLSVSKVDIQPIAHDRWQARFLQDYASAGHVEKDVPKTLDWVNEDGVWRIVAERQLPATGGNGSR